MKDEPRTAPAWAHPDAVRALITYAMLLLFGVVVVWVLAFPPPEKSFSENLVLILVTALVGKISTTIDFWHGSSDKLKEGPSGKPSDPISTTVDNAPSAPVPVEQTPETPPDE